MASDPLCCRKETSAMEKHKGEIWALTPSKQTSGKAALSPALCQASSPDSSCLTELFWKPSCCWQPEQHICVCNSHSGVRNGTGTWPWLSSCIPVTPNCSWVTLGSCVIPKLFHWGSPRPCALVAHGLDVLRSYKLINFFLLLPCNWLI